MFTFTNVHSCCHFHASFWKVGFLLRPLGDAWAGGVVFRLDNWAGPVRLDETEVAQIRWASLEAIRNEAEENPDVFTPWFLAEIRHLDWFSGIDVVLATERPLAAALG